MMKKAILFSMLLLILSVGCGCDTIHVQSEKTQVKEEPHLYWKDIDVVVTSVDKKHWYASTHWYEVRVTVESEEYQLTYTDTFKGSGAFGCPSQWEYSEGDIVTAELYSWVIDSTGEVVKLR